MIKIVETSNPSFQTVIGSLHQTLEDVKSSQKEGTQGGRKYLKITQDKEGNWKFGMTNRRFKESDSKQVAKFAESLEKMLDEGIDKNQLQAFVEDLHELRNYKLTRRNLFSKIFHRSYYKRIEKVLDRIENEEVAPRVLTSEEIFRIDQERARKIDEANYPQKREISDLKESVLELFSYKYEEVDPSLKTKIEALDEKSLTQLEDLLVKQGAKKNGSEAYNYLEEGIQKLLRGEEAKEDIPGKHVDFKQDQASNGS